MEIDCQSKPFIGVRFVLFGFDPINEGQVRSKLIDGGGVDVGLYTQSCTHVVVDNIVFDDSVCVAARTDGKTLVTSLWVDHSFDIGMPVDAASIMYRPLKDLNGIRGANSLVMCLTGYQRQDREDIMTMVRLMGSQFSKPLVANKVTHLICYKFEGEKYELAKKIKSIKLVNHRWLEDCLRVWELLPEANYDKSGYELETMEAEAKDSEEETEVASLKQFGGRDVNKSPHNLNAGIINARGSPKSTLEGQRLLVVSAIPEAPSGIDNARDMLSTPSRVSRSHQILSFDSVNVPEVNNTGASRDNCRERAPNSTKVKSDLVSTSKNAEISYHSGSKFSSLNYSRKTPRKSILTMSSGKVDNDVLDIISSKVENAEDRTVTACGEIPKRGESCREEELSVLPQKRMSNSTGAGCKSQKISHNAAACNPGSPINYKTPVSETKSSACHSFETGNHLSPGSNGRYTIETATLSTAPNNKPLAPDLPSLKTVTSEGLHNESADRIAPEASRESKESTVASKPDNEDFGMRSVHLDGEAGDAQNLHHDFEGSSAKNRVLVMDKSPRPVNIDSPQVAMDKLIAKPIRKKMVAKKTLGSGHTTNRKGSIYSNKISSLSNPTVCLIREVERANQEKFSSTSELETAPPNLSDGAAKEMDTIPVAKCGDNSGDRIKTMDDETEAPDEKDEIEFEKTLNNEKSEGVVSLHEEDAMMKRIPGVGHEAHDSMVWGLDVITGKEVMNTEVRMTVSGERFDLDGSASKMDGTKQKTSKRKNRPSGKGNGKIVSADKGIVESWDDETEAADEKVGNVFEKALNDEKSEGVELIHKEDAELKRIPGVGHEAHGSIVCSHDEITGKEGINTQVRTTLSGERFDLDESNSKSDGMKCKKNRAKKWPLGKASLKTLSGDKGTVESKKDVVGEENLNGKKNKEGTEKEKNVLLPRSKTRISTASASKVGSSVEVEKENRPVADEGQPSGPGVGKSILKSMKVPMKKLKDEPIWFILSGHRLQRKECQLVIRRLKGRLCRDSHQWSYQATHFITPDPIRRTEKFFAAAASGRWILKTDYLSACSQAGKFLPEEPYEWHKNGLSEDGAINLEAPRKWRLLRERTGHGAFHGMRIIVYGDCIAPPLDTLKRVVKAGDGNILATSPPYTRFLNSGVDFAVVSPGMPRVDLWVQEFLKHKIPCVVADYLVEFVCKPGYSLERHVQYNTHAWAEKSLSNMLSKAEEIVVDLTPPDDYDTDNITCQVCGCSDRGEVMLICGDKTGSVGCGVGTHIDCCDPPLESVPEEDWFCPKCTRSRINPSKRRNSS